MKQYQEDFSLNRKQRGLLFYGICVQYTKFLPKKLPPPRPQAHRFRTLFANDRRRRAQMPGDEAQGTTVRKKKTCPFSPSHFPLRTTLHRERDVWERDGQRNLPKVWYKCKVVVALIKPNTILTFRLTSPLLHCRFDYTRIHELVSQSPLITHIL